MTLITYNTKRVYDVTAVHVHWKYER